MKEFFHNIANLITIKSIITIAMIGCLIYLVIVGQVSSEAFMGVLGSIITYYFQKKDNTIEK
jgi:hypothetical protein